MMSRAALCELLAIKLARYYANDKTALATALTTNWRPTAGAPSEVVAEIKDRVGGSEEDLEDPNNALEVYLIAHIIMVEDLSHTLIFSSPHSYSWQYIQNRRVFWRIAWCRL